MNNNVSVLNRAWPRKKRLKRLKRLDSPYFLIKTHGGSGYVKVFSDTERQAKIRSVKKMRASEYFAGNSNSLDRELWIAEDESFARVKLFASLFDCGWKREWVSHEDDAVFIETPKNWKEVK